jgi:hypothetical protein
MGQCDRVCTSVIERVDHAQCECVIAPYIGADHTQADHTHCDQGLLITLVASLASEDGRIALRQTATCKGARRASSYGDAPHGIFVGPTRTGDPVETGRDGRTALDGHGGRTRDEDRCVSSGTASRACRDRTRASGAGSMTGEEI